MKILLMLFIFTLIKCNPTLEWKDPVSGSKYDFSSLKRNEPWKVKDETDNGLFSMIYYFNFESPGKRCNGVEAASAEFLEVLKQPTNTCEILGKFDSRTIGLLDDNDPKKGIYIIYGNGDKYKAGDNPAYQGKPRQTKIKINCANQQDEFKVDFPGSTQGTTKLIMEFRINSPAGCPMGTFNKLGSSTILFWVLILMCLYILIGYVYNVKKNNLQGKEALPHIEFWRDLPILVQEGISYTLNWIKNTSIWIKKRLSGNASGYSDI